jgi:hypothetical protein
MYVVGGRLPVAPLGVRVVPFIPWWLHAGRVWGLLFLFVGSSLVVLFRRSCEGLRFLCSIGAGAFSSVVWGVRFAMFEWCSE